MVIIADTANIAAALSEETQPEILGDVRILILVDEDIFELAMEVGEEVQIVLEQRDIMDQEIAKVAGIENLKPRLIGLIAFDA